MVDSGSTEGLHNARIPCYCHLTTKEEMSMDTNCEDCGGPGAEYLMDPYSHELYGEENYMWVCPGCFTDRAESV